MEVSIVVPDKQFKHIAYFLRSVTRSENTFYTHGIYLDDYPADGDGLRRPTFAQFKEGAPLYYSSSRFGFGLIEEKHLCIDGRISCD